MMMDYQQQQTSQQQQQQNNNKPTKSVTFHPTVYALEHFHLSEYTDDEMLASWYTEEEYDNITKELNVTIDMMCSGNINNDNDDDYCCRGLEHRTREAYKNRLSSITNSRFVVFKAQEAHKMRKLNVNMIPKLYMNHTRKSTRQAHVFGLQDQRDSLSFLSDISAMLGCTNCVNFDDKNTTTTTTTTTHSIYDQSKATNTRQPHQLRSKAA